MKFIRRLVPNPTVVVLLIFGGSLAYCTHGCFEGFNRQEKKKEEECRSYAGRLEQIKLLEREGQSLRVYVLPSDGTKVLKEYDFVSPPDRNGFKFSLDLRDGQEPWLEWDSWRGYATCYSNVHVHIGRIRSAHNIE